MKKLNGLLISLIALIIVTTACTTPYYPENCSNIFYQIDSIEDDFTSKEETFLLLKQYIQTNNENIQGISQDPTIDDFIFTRINITIQSDTIEIDAWVLEDAVAMDSDGTVYQSTFCG